MVGILGMSKAISTLNNNNKIIIIIIKLLNNKCTENHHYLINWSVVAITSCRNGAQIIICSITSTAAQTH